MPRFILPVRRFTDIRRADFTDPRVLRAAP